MNTLEPLVRKHLGSECEKKQYSFVLSRTVHEAIDRYNIFQNTKNIIFHDTNIRKSKPIFLLNILSHSKNYVLPFWGTQSNFSSRKTDSHITNLLKM